MKTGEELLEKLAVTESFLLTLGLGIFFNHFFNLRINTGFLFLFTISIQGVIFLLDRYKRNLLTYVCMAGILFGFLIISLFLKVNILLFIRNLYKWCLIYNGDEKLFQMGYALAAMAGIILLCGIITYFMHRIKMIKNIAAVILIVFMLVLAVKKVYIPKITVGVILFYSIWVLAEFCGKLYYKSSNRVNNSLATVYLAPVCIMTALISVTLPSGTEPIKWNAVIKFIHKVQEQSAILMNRLDLIFDGTGHEFSVNFTGYSEETVKLGGKVSSKDEIALKIKTFSKSTAAGYLIGSISDTYTGRGWEKDKRKEKLRKEDYYYDFYELLYAFTREKEAGNDLTNIIKSRNYDIEYYNIKTRSLFYPLKTYNINLFQKQKFKETPQGAFLSDKAKGIGFCYTVSYFELNLNHNTFQGMLRKAQSTDDSLPPEALRDTAKEIFHYDIAKTDFDINTFLQDRKHRMSDIKARYTTLPASLPERVKKLAVQLTQGYYTDYDKLKSIEAYLNTLTYTTRVNKTPEKEDFVDYFLFHEKKGYCTYFASAFAVLARCVGIPARYVEGFVFDYSKKDNEGSYLVNSNNAHAWAEAYLEGVGWIPFEPTPGFYSARYTFWQDEKKALENYDSSKNILQPYIPVQVQEVMNEEGKANENPYKWIRGTLTVMGITGAFIIFILGTFLIYYRILILKYRKKFKKASGREKLFLIMAEILHYLKKEGFYLEKGDTLLTFAERVGEKISFNRTDFLYISGIFMAVRYGEYEVKTDELKKAMDFAKSFRHYLEERLGKRRMFFDRFLYLHFSQ